MTREGPAKSGPVPEAPGFRFEYYDSLPSTNTTALMRAREGEAGGLWIRAGEQTQGRGRRGRVWSSNRGNMFASVLLRDPAPAERLGELPLVCAVALAEAVEKTVGAYGLVGLKWPNDLLVNEAKLSGILLEADTSVGTGTAIVCGFGVNCVSHPQPEGYQATDLAELGYRVQAEDLFFNLAKTLSNALENWRQEDGFAAVRRAWMRRAVRLGQLVKVRNGGEDLQGRFCEIDDSGRLVLELDGGARRLVSAGDVFFADTA